MRGDLPEATAVGDADGVDAVSCLVLEAVARQEGIRVSPDELSQRIEELAQAIGREPKEVAQQLERSGAVVQLAGDIIRNKALDLLVENAEVVEVDQPLKETTETAETKSAADSFNEQGETTP